MKKITLVLLITISFSCSKEEIFNASEQVIELTTQNEIDNFKLTNTEKIISIFEKENGGIKNLNGLKNLSSVGGLRIEKTSLTSLEGLENLKTITGVDGVNQYAGNGIAIGFNEKLISLKGLDNITTIGTNNYNSDFIIVSNPVLSSLEGLEKLSSVENGIVIRNNNNLSSINSLIKLESIGTLAINENNNLKSLKGLDNLTSVDHLLILNNKSLASLFSLFRLKKIESYLDIRGNKILTSLGGLNNITSIGKDIDIADNASLTSLEGLENITEIGGKLNIGRYSLDGIDFIAAGNESLINLCAIKQLISNEQINENEYFVVNNAYNPTYEKIQNNGSGGCEQ